MNQESIVGRLKRAGAEEFATPRRLGLLAQLSEIYESDGLLRLRSAPALHEQCPDRQKCWAPLAERTKPVAGEPWGYAGDKPGSIFWPWIGERYDRGGVAIVGLNFRSADSEATVALEYLAAKNDREDLASGAFKSRFGSHFPYRSLASASAVLDSLNGDEPIERPDPALLVGVGDRIARLQLVKCTPVDRHKERGSPSDAMCGLCPPRFLFRELAVLRPGAVIVFGNAAHRTLNSLPQVRWRNNPHHCRGDLHLDDHSCQIFWLPHPSGSHWGSGQRGLVRSLKRRPAGTRARSVRR